MFSNLLISTRGSASKTLMMLNPTIVLNSITGIIILNLHDKNSLPAVSLLKSCERELPVVDYFKLIRDRV